MTIPWIKCSGRMPFGSRCIMRNINNNELTRIRPEWFNQDSAANYEWIPYDEATWRECCLPVSPDNKL